MSFPNRKSLFSLIVRAHLQVPITSSGLLFAAIIVAPLYGHFQYQL